MEFELDPGRTQDVASILQPCPNTRHGLEPIPDRRWRKPLQTVLRIGERIEGRHRGLIALDVAAIEPIGFALLDRPRIREHPSQETARRRRRVGPTMERMSPSPSSTPALSTIDHHLRPTLRFDQGTLTIAQLGDHHAIIADVCVWDSRVSLHRAKASHYAEIIRRFHGTVAYVDHAKAYDVLSLGEHGPRTMRPYQQQALEAWISNQKRCLLYTSPSPRD
mgnify:CR=1 FL=1